MKNNVLLLFVFIFSLLVVKATSQGVAINEDNTPPDPGAILDIKSTSKGVLFPMLTTAQRNAISNPPHGLHIFNTQLGALEYYDAEIDNWISYRSDQAIFTDTIETSTYHYILPPGAANAQKIIIIIQPDVNVFGSTGSFDPAIEMSSASSNASIVIKNYGNVYGGGGGGGNGGGLGQPGQPGFDSWNYTGGAGGQPGQAIIGNPGNNTVINYGTGVIYGLVD